MAGIGDHGHPEKNPFAISKEDIDILNFEVFPSGSTAPSWKLPGKNIRTPSANSSFERIIFYLVSKGSTISHTIPNYGVVVERGLEALRKDARKAEAAATDEEQKDFYKGVDLALGGIINYAERLSRTARNWPAGRTIPSGAG